MVLTRRQYLAAATAAVAGVGTQMGPVSAQAEADCSELAATVDALETELAQRGGSAIPEESLAELQRRVMDRHAAMTPGEDFDEDVRTAGQATAMSLRESVVILDTRRGLGAGDATAWYVTEDLLVTNAHNVQPAPDRMGCVTEDGSFVDVELLGVDENQDPDVALLAASEPGTPVTTGDSTTLARGDPLIHVGHPAGFGYWVNTIGRYEHRETGVESDVLYTTVPSIKGSSGSPIADLDGNVVGLLFGGTARDDYRVDGVPQPAEPTVRYDLLSPDTWTLLVPIEDVLEQIEAWR